MLAYLLLSGLYMMVFHKRVSGEMNHILFRVFILLFILAAALTDKGKSRYTTLRNIRIFFPFLILVYLYPETDYLNNILCRSDLDWWFSGAEEEIFGCQPSLSFASTWHHNLWAEWMYFGYFFYYCMIAGVPLYIYFRISHQNGEKFAFILISSFLLYYLFFIIVPVAGPQFYFREKADPLPRGFIFGKVLRFIQHYGEGRTAAFPSSHVSISLMLVWGCFRYARKLLPLIIPVCILLIFSTVYLRAHYVIDVLGAMLTTPVVLKATARLFHSMCRRAVKEETKDIPLVTRVSVEEQWSDIGPV